MAKAEEVETPVEETTNTVEEVTPEVVEAPKKGEKTDREKRWDTLWDTYKETNPIKYEFKKANGEMDTIPDSFV